MRFFSFLFLMLWGVLSASCWDPAEIAAGCHAFLRPIVSSELEGEAIVDGVNVVTGCYLDKCIDVYTSGLDPLLVERSFYRPNFNKTVYDCLNTPNCHGWYLNYDQLCYVDEAQNNIALSDRTGTFLLFQKPSGANQFRISEKDGMKGFMNHASKFLSGQTHIKNAYLEASKADYKLHLGDGTERFFTSSLPTSEVNVYQYQSCMERKPNGNSILFDNDGIKTVASDGKTVLNWLKFNKQNENSLAIETSDAKRLVYHAKCISDGNGVSKSLIDKVILPDGNKIQYHYSEYAPHGTDYLTEKELPGGSYVRIFYFSYDDKKVHAIQKPVSTDNSPVIANRFEYGDHVTNVYDTYGHRTVFAYDDDARITKIERPKGSVERNVWSSNGMLLVKSLYNATGQPIASRCFSYDAAGNVVKERLLGNLSGKSKSPLLTAADGTPIENGVECYTKSYTYSNDGMNLLLSETDGISTTCYTYEDHTNLVKTKKIYDKDKLKIRQLNAYDMNKSLTFSIEDDGNHEDLNNLRGCSFRKIMRRTNRQNAPAAGMPELIEEKYFDFKANKECLLKRTQYAYNEHGDCIKETVFDAAQKQINTIQRAYDKMGRCVFEKDNLGCTTYAYDAAGNILEKRGPHPGILTTYGYDFSNRLVFHQEESGGIRRVKRYQYDCVGNKIVESDFGGNETYYWYDGGRRVTAILYPPILNEKGEEKKTAEHKKYDGADNLIEWRDERDDCYYAEYNVRGQPTHIKTIVKDGNIYNEFMEYDLRGNCIKKTARNGLVTQFSYDFLDRIVATMQYSADGVLLCETNTKYNAYFPTEMTDALGLKTTIAYDPAGRECLIEKEIGEGKKSRTEKFYDAAGRLSVIKEWHGSKSNDYNIKRLLYNAAGQLIEESLEDASKAIHEKNTYCYDNAGNQIQCIEMRENNQKSVVYKRFDGFGRVIEKEDALQQIWRIEYVDDMPNGRGQNVLYKKETDPCGCITETLYDVRGRVEKVLKKCKSGTVLSKQLYFYDELGNQVLSKEAIHASNPSSQWYVVAHSYTHDGKKAFTIEDADGNLPRRTYYYYNPCGELSCETKEGVGSIYYLYDAQGRIIQERAVSLNELAPIEKRYKYDPLGRIIEATQNGQKTERKYDGLGNLTYECQESGLAFTYTYDLLGRKTSMQLPDGTKTCYTYLGPHLHQIVRKGKKDETLYTHTLSGRDANGLVKSVNMIDHAGSLEMIYNGLGQIHSISSPKREESATYDAKGNVVQMFVQNAIDSKVTRFEYNCLNQLILEQGHIVDKPYTYDSLQNRLDGELGSCRQLLNNEESQFSWDQGGKLCAGRGKKAFQCSYDVFGRLIKYDASNYTYDAFDRRIGKNGKWFLYDGDDEVGVASKSGQISELRILGEKYGAERGATIAMELNGRTFAVVHDLRGNIAALINAKKGKTTEYYEYSAFGEMRIFDGYGHLLSNSWVGNEWMWNGKRQDPESGWVFYGKRYYFPQIGRWISPAYPFANNNPLTFFDAYGSNLEGQANKNTKVDFQKIMTVKERWMEKRLIPNP